MRRGRDLLQFYVLDLLAEAGSPVGAAALLQRVLPKGIDVSQATLGRALRALDERRLTLKLSNKGRVLTPEGRSWLTEARHRDQAQRWTEETLLTVGQSTLAELRQSMIARRAIEGEIARLAAESASPAQVQGLSRIVEEQGRELQMGGRGASQAVDFHLAVAQACGNRFLAAAANVVRTSSEALETLMYHLGATVGVSHREHLELVSAIAARDPRAAQDAMERHLNELIRDVDRLLARLANRAAMTGAPAAGRSTSHSEFNGSGNDRTGRPDDEEPAQHLAGELAPVSSEKEGEHNG